MRSPFSSTTRQEGWSPVEMIAQEERAIQTKPVTWWYRLTSTPEPPGNASFVKREAARKGRLLSTVVFFLMLTIIMLIPATLFIPNRNVILLCLAMLAICCISLFFNRKGKDLIAGTIVVITFEITFLLVITSTRPFDVTNLPLYDMLAMTELLAVSLLPGRNVFIVALINSLFIWGSLIWQPQTLSLDQYLQTQFYTALIRPVTMQLLVAVVAYLWVRSTTQAIKRADRAEMIARLEHTLVEQKRHLELGIQQILQTHTEIANGYLDTRSPLTQDNALWPLANALNTLITRFQRAARAEQDLQAIQVHLLSLVNIVQQAEQYQKPLPRFQYTGTLLDSLLTRLSGKQFIPSQASSDTVPQRAIPSTAPQHAILSTAQRRALFDTAQRRALFDTAQLHALPPSAPQRTIFDSTQHKTPGEQEHPLSW